MRIILGLITLVLLWTTWAWRGQQSAVDAIFLTFAGGLIVSIATIYLGPLLERVSNRLDKNLDAALALFAAMLMIITVYSMFSQPIPPPSYERFVGFTLLPRGRQESFKHFKFPEPMKKHYSKTIELCEQTESCASSIQRSPDIIRDIVAKRIVLALASRFSKHWYISYVRFSQQTSADWVRNPSLPTQDVDLASPLGLNGVDHIKVPAGANVLVPRNDPKTATIKLWGRIATIKITLSVGTPFSDEGGPFPAWLISPFTFKRDNWDVRPYVITISRTFTRSLSPLPSSVTEEELDWSSSVVRILRDTLDDQAFIHELKAGV